MISRKPFLALLAMAPLAAQLPAIEKKPNIIFILCDDLGYGDVIGRLGKGVPAISTPHLDRMASEGLTLDGLYCPAPVCAPSRSSLFTGVTQGHAEVRNNQFDKALEDNHTLGTVMRAAGYRTALIGKWGLQGLGEKGAKGKGGEVGVPAGWTAYPTKRGFDFYFGYVRHMDGHAHYPKENKKQVWENDREISASLDKCLTTDLFTARAKKWIVDTKKASPEKPFFLVLAYDTPHTAIQLPTGPYPAGGGLEGGLQWLGKPGRMITSADGVQNSHVYPEYDAKPGAVKNGKHAGSNEGWTPVAKKYATSISRIDDCVGDLLKLLKDMKLDDDTVVVFTSDNGPSESGISPEFFKGFGPFDGIKRDCWEGGVRVGGIARAPGLIPPGRKSDEPCQFQDWMTTFVALAGVPAPARADGVSLLPLLSGKGGQTPSRVYVEYEFKGATPGYIDFETSHRGRKRNQMQMIRLGDFTGVRYDVKSAGDPFEIYHVIKDPKEAHNLAMEMPEMQRLMQETVLRRRIPNPAAPRPYDEAPVPALSGVKCESGVSVAFHTVTFPWVPRLDDLKPESVKTSPSIESVSGKKSACLISGYLKAPVAGSYQFAIATSGGAFLRIHDASVVDADFGRKPGERREGSIRLGAGLHPFRLCRTAGKSGELESSPLLWKPPGAVAFSPVPAEMLGH